MLHMRKICFIILLISLLYFIGVSLAQEEVLLVKVGQTFNITLSCNPSTGYAWAIKYFDESLLQYINNGTTNCGPATGSGCDCFFEFKVLKTGSTRVLFLYYRSWEGEEKAIDSKNVTVQIEGYVGNYCYSDDDCYLECGFCKSKLNPSPYCGGVAPDPGYKQICECEDNYCAAKYVPINVTCGNGICEEGESTQTCCVDCPCPTAVYLTYSDWYCIDENTRGRDVTSHGSICNEQTNKCESKDTFLETETEHCPGCRDGFCAEIKIIGEVKVKVAGGQIKVTPTETIIKIKEEVIEVRLPLEQAVERIRNEKIIEKISEIEVTKTPEEKVIYKVIGQKDVKILGFIPVKASIEVYVDTLSGEVTNIIRPWWYFLVF